MKIKKYITKKMKKQTVQSKNNLDFGDPFGGGFGFFE